MSFRSLLCEMTCFALTQLPAIPVHDFCVLLIERMSMFAVCFFRVMVISIANLVVLILGIGAPSEVAYRVVEWIIIVMECQLSFRSRFIEGFEDHV